MGLSSFNRMRRERAPVEKMEAERFIRWRDERNAGLRREDRAEREREQYEIWQAEQAAMRRIGAKVEVGMEMARQGHPVVDEPLRRDHAAEIAGRNLHDVDQPKDPVQRIEERVPEGETANEQLVPHMSVEVVGPTAEQVRAAEVETGVAPEDEDGVRGPERGGSLVVRGRPVGEPAAREDLAVEVLPAPEPGEAHASSVSDAPAEATQDADGGFEDTVQDGGDEPAGAEADDGADDDDESSETRTRVRIPKDWKSLPAADKRKIAERLGAEVHNATEAAEAIQAEMDRRAAE